MATLEIVDDDVDVEEEMDMEGGGLGQEEDPLNIVEESPEVKAKKAWDKIESVEEGMDLIRMTIVHAYELYDLTITAPVVEREEIVAYANAAIAKGKKAKVQEYVDGGVKILGILAAKDYIRNGKKSDLEAFLDYGGDADGKENRWHLFKDEPWVRQLVIVACKDTAHAAQVDAALAECGGDIRKAIEQAPNMNSKRYSVNVTNAVPPVKPK